MIFRRSVVIYYLYSLVTTSTITTRFYNNNNPNTKRLISTIFTTAFISTNPKSRNNYYYNNIQRIIDIDTNRNQYNKNNFVQQQFITTAINNYNNNKILLPRQSMSLSTSTTENNNNHDNDNTIQKNNVETTTTEEEQKVVNDDNETNNVDDIRNVGRNYCTILNHIHDIAVECNRNPNSIRLIAVSKTKSVDYIVEAYNVGNCRYFGENYVQELITKMNTLSSLSNNEQQKYNDIQWHFIGTLQSNKCQMLINACGNNINQLTIETITSIKLANKLNSVIENKMKTMKNNKEHDNDCNNMNEQSIRLKVFVQVNTSGEESKGGIEPTSTACIELCEYILLHCQYLQLCGLMTIGAPNDTSCFNTLVQCRDNVLLHFKNQKENNDAYKHCINVPTELELSMGMSDDYVDAIRAGSTNVRIGSSIFGHRIYTIK